MSALAILRLFPDRRSTSLTGTLAVVLLYLAIYGKDWASSWGVSNSMAAVVLAAGLALGLGAWVTSRSGSSRIPTLAMGAFLASWILALLGQGRVNMSSYYIAIPCAFVVIHTNPRLLIRLLIIHLALTLVIQSGEYASGKYLFIYQGADGSELNESMFGGANDVFRAKGLFQGPLSAVAFALWMAFFFRGNVTAAAVLFFCAFFASGRLGMLTSSLLIMVRIFRGMRRTGSLLRMMPLVVGLITAAGFLLAYSDENRLLFILSAIDIGNNQNVSRIYFWKTSLAHFFTYSPQEILVGNYGLILRKEGGTENDFLRLLLDCGVIGLLIYVFAIIALLRAAIRRRDPEDLLVALLIIVLMNVFPFVQSLSSALLFWVYFFVTMRRRIPQTRAWAAGISPDATAQRELA
jgi:hypothetical protein